MLRNIKGAVDARISVCHSATIAANALMHAGTTVDTFLRDNLDWLARATNWAKFGATASLGVIHRHVGWWWGSVVGLYQGCVLLLYMCRCCHALHACCVATTAACNRPHQPQAAGR